MRVAGIFICWGCWKGEVVGETLKPLAGFYIEASHAAKRVRIHLEEVDGRQDDGVIGANARQCRYSHPVDQITASLQVICDLISNMPRRKYDLLARVKYFTGH